MNKLKCRLQGHRFVFEELSQSGNILIYQCTKCGELEAKERVVTWREKQQRKEDKND